MEQVIPLRLSSMEITKHLIWLQAPDTGTVQLVTHIRKVLNDMQT